MHEAFMDHIKQQAQLAWEKSKTLFVITHTSPGQQYRKIAYPGYVQGEDGIGFLECDSDRLNYFSYPCVVESVSQQEADLIIEEQCDD